MKNKVSVIIPTYKRITCIDRAINSILNQSYKNFEIIIVDDNEKDSVYRKKTEEYMKKYSNVDNIKYIKHEKNKNGAVARNTGIKYSSGDFITFLDDDDFYLPNRLEVLVNVLLNNPRYDGAYTGSVTLKNKKIVNVTYGNESGNLILSTLKQKAFYRTGSNMFFRRKCFDKIIGFDDSFLRHQDLELMVRFFEYYEIIGVPEILVVKDSNNSMNPNILKAIEYRKKFIGKYMYLINKFNSDDVKKIYYSNIVSLMKTSLENKDLETFKKLKIKLLELGCNYDFKLFLINYFYYLNNFVSIKNVKHYFYNCFWKCKLDKYTLQSINDIINVRY